ncbi:hypothetical protein GCM10010302_65730 [Streptomyces polychromogenes]|uniref:Uncharacterized protein n=1 Tax=Streptomyces polychromogenes TaxID=67342 RepID=A0ABP3FGT4_9ACTN
MRGLPHPVRRGRLLPFLNSSGRHVRPSLPFQRAYGPGRFPGSRSRRASRNPRTGDLALFERVSTPPGQRPQASRGAREHQFTDRRRIPRYGFLPVPFMEHQYQSCAHPEDAVEPVPHRTVTPDVFERRRPPAPPRTPRAGRVDAVRDPARRRAA